MGSIVAGFSQKSPRIRLKKNNQRCFCEYSHQNLCQPEALKTKQWNILYVGQLYWVCWISWMKQFLGFGVYNRKCQKPQQFWEWMNSLCHSANLNIGQYCGFIIIHWCESDDLKFFAGFLSEIIKFLSVKIDAIAS